MTLQPPTQQEWYNERHMPALVAYQAINKIMDKYEPKHKGAWMGHTLAHHATHAVDHINSFLGALGSGAELTPEIIEDVESCLTRCAFILANIKRGPADEAPPTGTAEAAARLMVSSNQDPLASD